jgi:hypothetical protein
MYRIQINMLKRSVTPSSNKFRILPFIIRFSINFRVGSVSLIKEVTDSLSGNLPVSSSVFFFHLAVQPNSGLGRLHETLYFTTVTRSRTVGRTPWTGDQLVARPLPVHKHRKMHTQHKH